MKTGVLFALGACLVLTTAMAMTPASAQVAQWNQTVVDRELRSAFYRALREVAVAYINELEEAGVAGTITFVDHQLDYPLQLTSSSFRHVTLNAAQGKAAYLLRYQAKTTAGTRIPLGIIIGRSAGVLSQSVGLGQANPYSGGAAEIAGDGGMMLCPVNRSGLEFMFGALAVATLGDNGEFRVEEDGDAIVALHDAVLERTYELYGSSP